MKSKSKSSLHQARRLASGWVDEGDREERVLRQCC